MIANLIKVLKNLTDHPLNREQKAKTIFRFLKWSILFRIKKEKIVFDWLSQSKILVTNGMAGSTGCVYAGLFEFEDMAFLLHTLQPDDLFIDVGANVGVYTVLASKEVGAKSISFEPIPSTYETLQANINLNKINGKTQLHNLGVGKSNSKLHFTNNRDTTNHVVKEGTQSNTIEVDVMKLDDILENEKPNLMKIDVEGFETEVIGGAKKILEKESLMAIIIELNGQGAKYGYDEDEIHNLFLSHDFHPINYDPFKREFFFDKRNQKGNTIYIRKKLEKTIRARIATSKKINVLNQTF